MNKTKKLITVISAVVLTVLFALSVASASVVVWNLSIASGFASGSGTETDPYIIETAEQLAFLADTVNNGVTYSGKYIVLSNDIKLNDESFVFDADTGLVKVTDGTNTAYLGTDIPGDASGNNSMFDTYGSYRNAWYDSPNEEYPGVGYGGVINSWTPIGTSTSSFQGNFNGNGYNISGVYINDWKAYQGLFGYISGGVVTNVSVSDSYISGDDNIGGIAGELLGTLSGCNYSGFVGGYRAVGGIVGSALNHTVTDCRNTSTVSGIYYLGGIAGSASYVISCENSGTVFGTDEYIGGICGSNILTSDCHNTGKVTGVGYVGGITGDNLYTLNCSNAGGISGEYVIGGIAGSNYQGSITNCYNTGNISGDYGVGGICGEVYEYGCVRQSYSSGSVKAQYSVGSIAGISENGWLEDCYYLKSSGLDGSGKVQNGIGAVNKGKNTADTAGSTTALTSSQMKNQTSFSGFDFEYIWTFETSDGYLYPRFIKNVDPSFGEDSALWTGAVANGFASGSGTETDPYIIENAEQLAFLASSVNSGTTYEGQYIKLKNDIKLNDSTKRYWTITATKWIPIGTNKTPFKGSFDGNGHIVSGLYIDTAEMQQGLFGYTDSADLVDITVSDSYIFGYSSVGGIAGYSNEGTITRCTYNGIANGIGNVGGIVGGIHFTVVTECRNNGSINVIELNAGGITGYNSFGDIIYCSNTGDVNGSYYTGGVVGESSGSVRYSSNSGRVSGKELVGGVFGNDTGTQETLFCYNSGAVTGGSYVGGISGKSDNETVFNCYSVGSVTGNEYVGALCGSNQSSTPFYNCFYLQESAVNTNGQFQNALGTGADPYCINALTEAQMQNSGSYFGFDFVNEWTIDPSTGYEYPQPVKLLDASYGENAALWTGEVAGGFASGSGTEDDPYIIETAEQLAFFASSVNNGTSYNGKYIELANDIKLNDNTKKNWILTATQWTAIGTEENRFEGSFDGNGCTIYGLYIDTAKRYQGLFGYIRYGEIRNVTVADSYINGYCYAGGIVGYSDQAALIGCINKGYISSSMYAGGIAGCLSESYAKNCGNYGSVFAVVIAGGICGDSSYSMLADSFNAGSVLVHSTAGGLSAFNSGFTVNCYNAGSVRGCFSVGALFGAYSTLYTTELYTADTYYMRGSAVDGAGTVQNSYGENTLGAVAADTYKGITALTASQMKNESSFYGFDFVNEWTIEPLTGYEYPQFVKLLDASYGENAAVWTGTVAGGFASGSGTEDDPYIIETAEQLAFFASSVNNGTSYNGKYIKLANDIKLNDNTKKNWILTATQWTAIGTEENRFEGSFDGNGCTIYGLYTDAEKSFQGLFGYIDGATVSAVTVADSYVNGRNHVGGVVGYNYAGTVANCHSSAIVGGKEYIGGIAGCNSGTVTNCYNTGAVHGQYGVGGITGNNSGTVINCYNIGEIRGEMLAGGIVGRNFYGKAECCYNTGSVSGYEYIGSIAGFSLEAKAIANCIYLKGCAYNFSGIVQNGIGAEFGTTADTAGSTSAFTADQMKQKSSFEGFDFDTVWLFCENYNNDYPVLSATLLRYIYFEEPENKIQYAMEYIDLSDMVLQFRLPDGTCVPLYNYTCSIGSDTPLTLGTHTVEISYNTFCAQFDITVIPKPISVIALSDLDIPARDEYPDMTVTVDAPQYNRVVFVQWSTEKPFKADSKYTVTIVLESTENAEYSEDTVVLLNGSGSDAFYDSETGRVTVTYTFSSIIKYNIHVLDIETGKPVVGAKVYVDSNTAVTDSEGIAHFELRNGSSAVLKITADGYPEYINNSYAISRLPDDYIRLEISDVGIYSATCNDDDILYGKTIINRKAPEMSAVINIQGRSNANIVNYQLLQDGVVLAESEDGKFVVKNSKFLLYKTLTVRMTTDGANGHNTYEKKLNICVISFAYDFDIDLTDLFGADFSIPNDIPLLSGMKFTFPHKNGDESEVKVKCTNTKVIITYGYKEDLISDKAADKKSYSEILKALKKEYLDAKLKKSTPQKNIDSNIDVALSLIIEFNEDGEVIATYGEICVEAELKGGVGQTYVILAIPVRLEVNASLGASITISNLGFDWENSKLLIPDFNLGLKGSLNASAGFGISAISAGVYGGGSIDMSLNVYPDWGLEKLTLKGELGLYGKVKLFFIKLDAKLRLLEGEVTWPKTYRLMTLSLYDLAEYDESARLYLATRTEWLGDSVQRTETNSDTLLQGSCYTDIQPQTVIGGDTEMMLFLDDDGSDGVNYQHLYFSVYDPESSVWSSPEKVDSNGLPDIEFEVFSHNGKIYVAYVECGEITEQNQTDYEVLASTFEVIVAEYSATAGGFINHTNVSCNDSMDTLPQLTATTDGIAVAWVNNITNDCLIQNANNVIYFCEYIDGQWNSAKAITGFDASVTSMDMGELNGETYVAVVRDIDCDYTTDTDRAVYVIDTNGNTVKIFTEENVNEAVCFAELDGNSILLWYNGGNLYSLASPYSQPEYLFESAISGFTSDYCFVKMSDGTYAVLYTAAETVTNSNGEQISGSDIYGIFRIDGEWSAPVTVTDTDDDRYIDSFAVIAAEGKLVVPYVSTAVEFTEDDFYLDCDFVCSVMKPRTDLKINDVYVNGETLFDGDEVDVWISVTNDSINTLSAVTVELSDASGNTVFSRQITCNIKAGRAEMLGVSVPVDILTAGEQYTICVIAEYVEFDLSNNTCTVPLWYSDMNVVADSISLPNKNLLRYAIYNEGNIAGSGKLTVYTVVDGIEKVLHTYNAESVLPGESVSGVFEITDEGTVYIRFEATSAEYGNSLTEISLEVSGVENTPIVEIEDPDDVAYLPVPEASLFLFDKNGGSDIAVKLDEKGADFVGVKDIDEALYTYKEGLLTLKAEHLMTLAEGKAYFELEYSNGSRTMEVLLCVDIVDTTLRSAAVIAEQTSAVYYDGYSVEANKDFTFSTSSKGVVTFSYSTDGIIWREGLPVNAGMYTVRINIGEDAVNGYSATEYTFSLTVSKGTRAVSVPSKVFVSGNNVYFEDAHVTAEATDGSILYGYGTTNDALTVSIWSASGVLPVTDTPQVFYIFAKVCGSENYEDAYSVGLAVDGHIHTEGSERITDKAASCTEAGSYHTECTGCQAIINTGSIPATGHTHIATVTAPTCTEQGYTTYTCHCGDSYVADHVDALGHRFTDYVSDKNATSTADGTKTAKCDRGCGATDTVTDEGSKLMYNDITSDVYTVAEGYISGVSVDTTVNKLVSVINEKEYIRVVKDGNTVSGTVSVATGMRVQLMNGDEVVKEVIVVVAGDTNGDGKITVTDMIAVKSHILKKSILTGAAEKAGDTNGDNSISITDFIRIKAHILGNSSVAGTTKSAGEPVAAEESAVVEHEPETTVQSTKTVYYLCVEKFLLPEATYSSGKYWSK